jgi:hypothetical protein
MGTCSGNVFSPSCAPAGLWSLELQDPICAGLGQSLLLTIATVRGRKIVRFGRFADILNRDNKWSLAIEHALSYVL